MQDFTGTDGGVNLDDVSISSETDLSVCRLGSNGVKQLVHIVFGESDLKALEVDVDHFAVSSDGKFLLVSVESTLLLINYETYEFVDEMAYPNDCIITRIQWITPTTAALVSTKGLLLFDVENRTDMFIIASLDPSIKASQVIGVYVDVDSQYYLLQIEDGSMGKVQIGRFYSQHRLLEGIAGCLCRLDTCYVRGLVAVLLTKHKSNESEYVFKVLPLDDSINMRFRSTPIQLSDLSRSNRPEFVIPDVHRGLAYVVFRNGYLHIWDILNSNLTHSTLICSKRLLAFVPCSANGFISIWEGENSVLRITLEDLALIYCYYDPKIQNEVNSLHVAIRMHLHDTENPLFQELIHSLFLHSKTRLVRALTPFLNIAHFNDPTCVVKRFLADDANFTVFGGYLYCDWRNGKGINWNDEVIGFLGQFDISEPDAELSQSLRSSLRVVDDVEDVSSDTEFSLAASLGRQQSVRLTSLYVPSVPNLDVQEIISDGEEENSQVAESIPSSDNNRGNESINRSLSKGSTGSTNQRNEKPDSNSRVGISHSNSSLLSSITSLLQSIPPCNQNLTVPTLIDLLVALFVDDNERIQAMREITTTLGIPEIEPRLIGISTEVNMDPFEALILRIKRDEISMNSPECREQLQSIYPDMYERSKAVVQLRKRIAQ